jgi:hypothetical protein
MFKDAKLFGLINIIDLFIVLGIIGVAIFGIRQFTAGEGIVGIGAPETREFYISWFTEEVESFTAYAINVGDGAWDNARHLSMGVVTDVQVNDAIIFNPDQHGNTVRSNREGWSSIEITARLSAVPSENGILIAGNRYGVGHSMAVRAGSSIIFMRVSGLEEIG